MYNTYKSTPLFINSDCIFAAIISGTLWGIAEIAWFIANKNIGFSVSFPIITSGPGFIGAMWGVFYFKEISGKRNLGTLALAFTITLPGLIMIALSH
jgi:glucose uptake protein GlcU